MAFPYVVCCYKKYCQLVFLFEFPKQVCLTENINRSGFVALTRTAFNLAGKTDKLVFSSDVSKNTTGEGVAKISGDSIIDER